MFRRQKGYRPFIRNLLALILLPIAIFLTVGLTVELIHNKIFNLDRFFDLFFPLLLVSFAMLILVSKYPDIKFSKGGVHYKYLMFFGGFINWKEFSGLIMINRPRSMKGIYALIIDREGYIYPFWFKGLYFPTMHSFRLGTYSPIILITPESISEEERRKVKEIINNPNILTD